MKVTVGELRRIIREVLAVSCHVDRSGIPGAGNGLYSDEAVPAGSVVGRWVDGIDGVYAEEDLSDMDPKSREEFEEFASWDGDRWYLSGDDGKYMNHSDDPNVGVVAGHAPDAVRDRVALRPIRPGDELTMDYSDVGIDGIS